MLMKIKLIFVIVISALLTACGKAKPPADKSKRTDEPKTEQSESVNIPADTATASELKPDIINPAQTEPSEPESNEDIDECLIKWESGDNAIYLDIDNDGTEEKTEYYKEQNILKITKNNQPFIEANLYDYGVPYSWFIYTALYYYEYVKDSDGGVFLHIYASSLIGDGSDGNRYASASETYYKIIDKELSVADVINYLLIWNPYANDYSPVVKTEISVNGQQAPSLESIETKYTAIKNTYYEIPY